MEQILLPIQSKAQLVVGLEFYNLYDSPEISLIIRQLNRKLSKLPKTLIAKTEALYLEKAEELGEELLDFSTIADLEQWLANRPKPVDQQ